MDNINVDITDDTQSVNIVITEETQDVTLHLEAVGEKGDKGDKGDTGEPAQVVPLCDFGDYCSGTITLSAPITDYQKLYFICGNDALQTITVLTDTTKHKLMWDADNDDSAWKTKLHNVIIITISNSTVTINSSNVTQYGIRQVFAE